MYINATVFGHFIENALPDDHVHHTRVGYAATLPHASPTPIDSLLGGGGYSLQLSFWWALDWPEDIVHRTRLPGKDPDHISINLLEFAALLIGFAASIMAWKELPVDSRPPHPIVLGIFTDNTTALSWSQQLSISKTPASQALALILVSMMIGTPLVGLRTEYIPGPDNIIADFLSCMKHQKFLTAATFYFTMVHVLAAIRIIARHRALNLPSYHPLAVYTPSGLATPANVSILKDSNINTELRVTAASVYSMSFTYASKRYSMHSIRVVGACVALHANNASTIQIKVALQWKCDTVWEYLRNVPLVAARTSHLVGTLDPMNPDNPLPLTELESTMLLYCYCTVLG
jgi:hypothetical protein